MLELLFMIEIWGLLRPGFIHVISRILSFAVLNTDSRRPRLALRFGYLYQYAELRSPYPAVSNVLVGFGNCLSKIFYLGRRIFRFLSHPFSKVITVEILHSDIKAI